MRKIWIYLLGILSGIVLTFLASYLINKKQFSGITFFDEPGEIVTTQSILGGTETVNGFEVFQVLDDGVALATGNEWYTRDLIVLLWNENGESYYDNQSVVAPKGQCFRQVGIYKYKSKDKMHRTIPVVTLMGSEIIEEDEGPNMKPSTYGNGMSFFDEPGEVMSDKSYKVSRVVSDGAALARGKTNYGSYYGLEVLLWDEKANYYDNQIVNAPSGKCFRQIGIYKSGISTYPIVALKDSNVGQKSEAKKTTKKEEKPKSGNIEKMDRIEQIEQRAEPRITESNNAKLDKNKAYRLVKD